MTRGIGASIKTKAFHVYALIRVTTLRKFFNLLAIKTQRWLRVSRVRGMPYRYVIDPVNYCVLNCPLCPTGQKHLGRSAGKFPLERYKEIIDVIAPYTYYLDLFNWGEPFLHPQIWDLIAYASSRKILVRISSNLNTFDNQNAEKLVRSGLTDLLISLDGADQATYESYRSGGSLEHVIAAARAIIQAKAALHSARPFVNVRMLVTRKNEDKIHEVRRLARDLGADVFSIAPIFINPSDQDAVNEWLPENPAYSCYDNKQGTYQVENVWSCADLWEQMTINWDGSVLPCCWLHKSEFDFGNVFTTPLPVVWNNDYYTNSRRVFSRQGPENAPRTVCIQCKGKPEFRY
ncbi:MAG: radical SAM protein [Anaerolineae bacterium]|nr:radical SAM protein [Anaerolineae bacterium]